jgi:DNA-binding phage protein
MQSYMPHYCGNASRIHAVGRNNAALAIRATMKEQQRALVEWMADVIERRGIAARAWSEKAGLGKDTVSRAMREDYEYVTTTTTLAKLAEAIGERPPGLAAAIPSVESLTAILKVVQQNVLGEARADPELTRALAEALRDTLLHLADEPEAAGDPKVALALARASMRQRARTHA